MSRRTGAAVVALVAALGVSGCTGSATRGVSVDRVHIGDVAETIEAPAAVLARATATVSSPAAGTVQALSVRDGQTVRRGQVVLRIGSPSARAALAAAEKAQRQSAVGLPPGLSAAGLATAWRSADQAAARSFTAARTAAAAITDPAVRASVLTAIARAQAQYVQAALVAQQLVGQVAGGLASVGDVLGALSASTQAQATAALAAARATVDALTVRAPIGGTVNFGTTGGAAAAPSGLSSALSQLSGALPAGAGTGSGSAAAGVVAVVTRGALVRGGDPLFTVTDTSRLSLVAEIDETDILLVAVGQHGSAELDAVPGGSYPVTVVAVGLTPATSSRGGVSYQVRLALGAGTLAGAAAPVPRPGMSAVVDLVVRSVTAVVTAPAAAVFRHGGQDAVWLVVGGVARLHVVVVGAEGPDTVQITSGLAVGDQIVVHGAAQVHEGMAVPGR